MGSVIKHYFTVRRGIIPTLLCLPLGLLSVLLLQFAICLPSRYHIFLKEQTLFVRSALVSEGIQGLILTLTIAFGIGVFVFLAGQIIGFARKLWTLSLLRSCYTTVYLLGAIYTFAVFRITGLVFEVESRKTGVGSLDAVDLFMWRWELLWPVAGIALFIVLLHILSWRRITFDIYTGYHEDMPAPGDRIVENIRTYGQDPRFRKSVIASSFVHFAVIVLVPVLVAWFGRGCIEDYLVPLGAGDPVVSIVTIVKPKKKPRKRMILNPKSAISFHFPDLNNSPIQEQVEEMTQLTYVADATAVHKTGKGRGGKCGGWPDGMKNAVVRFIRLEYNGEDWNDGMDTSTRADLNFLEEFHKITGFKVASHSESNPIRRLEDYTRGYAPPFVFMTGSGQINISPHDVKILRKYLLGGGMLFADCGSPRWDRNFRSFMQVLFPGEALLVISDDDPIYQMPFVFANGAPSLWHHGGSKALGIKRGRRWVVYYHPGDINDAWKTGHSGVRPHLAKRAYHLGINIVYYAFTHYLEATRKYRK